MQSNDDDMTNESGISILLVAAPGPLRSGLEALLRSMLSEGSTLTANDADTMMDHIVRHKPRILLVDLRLLGRDAWLLFHRVKHISPHTQRIVLAEDVAQQEAVATPAAEEVFLKGSAPAELVAAIERRLSESAQPARPQAHDAASDPSF